MRRALHPLAAIAAAAIALTAAPAVDAALPKKGRFVNRDQAKGLYMETTRRNINTLWLFCRNPKYDRGFRPELRASRFEIPHPLHIRRDGTFRFKGKAKRYGAEGQPLGRWRMKLSGRFTSRTRVRIKRTLNGCDTRTVSARRTGGL